MDYPILAYGGAFILGGLVVAAVSFRKGWMGFKNASAIQHQRRVDLLGVTFCSLYGVGMIAGGIFTIVFFTQESPPSRMSNMTSPPTR